MTLSFPKHPDVVFGRAPLTQVLCQIRFSPILALMDQAGVSGFHEALRRDYPEFDVDQEAQISMSSTHTEVQTRAPVWRLRDSDELWQVSLAVDFVALGVSSYSHFEEFSDRLSNIISVLERTLNPGRSKRIGLRKTNRFEHPDVEAPESWRDFLRGDLLGLVGVEDIPGTYGKSYSELHLEDDEGGVLTIRHSIEPNDSRVYLLDLDYWTTKSMQIFSDASLGSLLKSYSDAMTGFFHWNIERSLYEYLGPVPRSEVAI